MGTTVEAWSSDGDEQLRDWFELVESVCSRFRPDSEITKINESTETMHDFSPLLGDVLRVAAHARMLTGGLVDIGAGSAVLAWGYDRTFEEVADLLREPARPAASDWGFRAGGLWRSPGTSLDLGGIAKGWACDRAVEIGMAVVVSAGGDIRSAADDAVVPVLDPWGATVARVRLGAAALATSSTSKRRWRAGGREVSHIIDPRSMAPVDSPVLSASVVAATASDAEAGAKAVLIHGADGLAWADAQDWIRSALVVWDDGSVYATPDLEWAE